MKTIDMLVWSVQPGKTETDREKLNLINEKLFSNIRKVLRLARLDNQEVSRYIKRVEAAQKASFHEPDNSSDASSPPPVAPLYPPVAQEAPEPTRQPADPRWLQEALNLPVGVWMEFDVDGARAIRCTLAAKVSEPVSYLFVNRQGVKVLDKPVADVACELEAGTARRVSDNMLFDRAIDTVIARLRARNEKRKAQKSKARPGQGSEGRK